MLAEELPCGSLLITAFNITHKALWGRAKIPQSGLRGRDQTRGSARASRQLAALLSAPHGRGRRSGGHSAPEEGGRCAAPPRSVNYHRWSGKAHALTARFSARPHVALCPHPRALLLYSLLVKFQLSAHGEAPRQAEVLFYSFHSPAE